MSEENVEIVRGVFDPELDWAAAFRDEELLRKNWSFVADSFETDFETIGVPAELIHTSAVGFEGFRQAWSEWLSSWQTWFIEPEKFIPLSGDRVLALAVNRATSKTRGGRNGLSGGLDLDAAEREDPPRGVVPRPGTSPRSRWALGVVLWTKSGYALPVEHHSSAGFSGLSRARVDRLAGQS